MYIYRFPIISHTNNVNRIGGVMVSVFASSAIDRGFEPQSCHTKDYEIGIYCFSSKHAALRNRDDMSEWGDMSIRGLLLQ